LREAASGPVCLQPQLTSHPPSFVEMALPQGLSMDFAMW
jgi:hypothetical protein